MKEKYLLVSGSLVYYVGDTCVPKDYIYNPKFEWGEVWRGLVLGMEGWIADGGRRYGENRRRW